MHRRTCGTGAARDLHRVDRQERERLRQSKSTPYRTLLVYEPKAGAWRRVAGQFSFAAAR